MRFQVSGPRFVSFPSDPSSFLLRSSETSIFDVEARMTEFEDYCADCENFGAIAGATPAYLKAKPEHDLSETDVHFGSGNGRSPLLIVSENFRSLLLKEEMVGPVFRKVVV